MSKRYLGGGVSFEQKDVYQEFSEEEGGGSTTLAGLTDVDISEPANGETLVYNSTSEKWENGEGGGSSTLVGLTDVDISNPADGQVLVYNATSGKWENGQGSSGGGVLVVRVTESGDTITLDKTWQEIYDADAVSIVWVEEGVKTHMLCMSVSHTPPPGGGDYVYVVVASDGGDMYRFETNSASGYPSYTFDE